MNDEQHAQIMATFAHYNTAHVPLWRRVWGWLRARRPRYPVFERRLGVTFRWHRAELLYVWPWLRAMNADCKWADRSLNFAAFPTLADDAAFWRGYNQACGASDEEARAFDPEPAWWERLLERLIP